MLPLVDAFAGSNYVPGIGPIPSDVMIIGEAPGSVEDRLCKPFIGPSGRQLNKVLDNLTSLQRNDIYVTNVVKHRPPKNRTPKVSEVKAYLPLLHEEVKRVSPKLIITLGGVAYKVFNKSGKVTSDHGMGRRATFGEWEGLLVPWLHPSFAMRKPEAFATFASDAARLQQSVDMVLEGETPTSYYLTTEAGVMARMREADPTTIGFDTETTSPTQGRHVFMTDQAEMVGWSVSWEKGVAYYVEASEFGYDMVCVLEANHIMKVCHNAKFEYKLLKKMGIFMHPFQDTKLAAYLCGENPTGLKTLTRQWLGVDPIKYEDVTKGKDMSELSAEAITNYAAADADHTLRLWKYMVPAMQNHKQVDVYRDIELPLIPVLSKMEARGVLVDDDECWRTSVRLADCKDKSGRKVDELINSGTHMNISSGNQLEKWLIANDAPLKKRTESGERFSVDTEALLEIREWWPELVDHLLNFRKYAKMKSYTDSFMMLRGPDARIHSSLNQSGHFEETGGEGSAPSTGRLSSSGPNLTNIPHHRATVEGKDWSVPIRNCIVAKPGFVLLSADLGQEEPRIIAAVAQDQTLLEGFANGRDIYRPTTESMYPYTMDGTEDKEWKRTWDAWERFTGKQIFLARYYGAGANRVQSLDPSLSMPTIAAGLARLDEAHPARQAYLDETLQMILTNGWAESLFGRRRWFPGAFSAKKAYVEEALRQAANMRIQGTAADILKIALTKIDQALQGMESGLLFTVHDEGVLEVKVEELEDVVPIVRAAFRDLLPGIDLILEVFVGERWGEREFVPES